MGISIYSLLFSQGPTGQRGPVGLPGAEGPKGDLGKWGGEGSIGLPGPKVRKKFIITIDIAYVTFLIAIDALRERKDL